MKNLFKSLSIANVALLVLVVVWGHFLYLGGDGGPGASFDVLAAIVAVFCALVHSIVYTYFIASGRFVESAIEEHGFADREVFCQVRRNKRIAFRYAFLAMCATMIGLFCHFAAAGPALDNNGLSGWWVALASYIAVVVNVGVIRPEWKQIIATSVITAEILADVARPIRSIADPGDGNGSAD